MVADRCAARGDEQVGAVLGEQGALAREESRGGHTRDDFPGPNDEWGTKNLVVNLNGAGTGVDLHEKPLPEMPDELKGYLA